MQHTSVKTKFQQETFMMEDLPETEWAPARLDLKALEAGMVKYFNPIKHHSCEDIFTDLVKHFNLELTPQTLLKRVNEAWDANFDLLDKFIEKPLEFDLVVDLAIHDMQGSLRGSTSAGLGFKKDRKTLARTRREDFRKLYDVDRYDFSIYWKLFLKDELRLLTKKTRSIAVAQLHHWFITIKHLGGLYYWFSQTEPEWSGFGMDDRVPTWTDKFGEWDFDAVTYGYDIRNQDSKMSPGFIHFVELFLKRFTPPEQWEAIEWILDEAYIHKKVVDIRGNVLQFSQGEMSGFSMTILFNVLHNLFMHVVHSVITDIQGKIDRKKFVILGDDTIMQTLYPEIFKEVAFIIGHETTSESGAFFNEIEFLSQKLNLTKWGIAPYYSNLPKMFASLLYTTGTTVEYFQKLCSFRNLLVFAPKGSEEAEWYTKIDEHATHIMKLGVLSIIEMRCYKTKYQLIQSRIGWSAD